MNFEISASMLYDRLAASVTIEPSSSHTVENVPGLRLLADTCTNVLWLSIPQMVATADYVEATLSRDLQNQTLRSTVDLMDLQ
jgi:hypothetical protein